MELAVDTSTFRSLPLETVLQEIAKVGFKSVEIGLGHFFPATSTDEGTRKLATLLEQNGLTLGAMLGIYPVSSPEEETRKAAVRSAKRAIEVTASLDCQLMASELGGSPAHRQACREAFLTSMRELIPSLEESGLSLCYEAHPGDFLESSDEASQLIREIGSQHVRYLYCTPHTFILGNDIGSMISRAKDVLGYVHVADSLRPEKTFFAGRYYPEVLPHQHLIPGLGDVDFRTTFLALKENGYAGLLGRNPFSHFDRPTEAVIRTREAIQNFLE